MGMGQKEGVSRHRRIDGVEEGMEKEDGRGTEGRTSEK